MPSDRSSIDRPESAGCLFQKMRWLQGPACRPPSPSDERPRPQRGYGLHDRLPGVHGILAMKSGRVTIRSGTWDWLLLELYSVPDWSVAQRRLHFQTRFVVFNLERKHGELSAPALSSLHLEPSIWCVQSRRWRISRQSCIRVSSEERDLQAGERETYEKAGFRS